MKRDLGIVGGIWLILTLALALAARADLFPLVRADKGEEVKHAFQVLVYFAVPVFALVVAVLGYSVLRYRVAGRPDRDGPPLLGRGGVPRAWFGITAALAVTVMIYPGLIGIGKVMKDEPNPDVVVRVQGTRWAWLVGYPQHEVISLKEIVLPVDKRVRFEITAADVVHSVWLPAFLLKIDAVPGLTTRLSFRPTQTGDFATDETMRLQCAELCGRDHALMTMPMRVVSAEEFEAWVRQQTPGQLDAGSPARPAAHQGH